MKALNVIHPKTRKDLMAEKAYHLAEIDRIRTHGADWDDDEGANRRAVREIDAQLRRWRS